MSALSLSSGHNAALAICIRMTWPEACLAVFVFLVMICGGERIAVTAPPRSGTARTRPFPGVCNLLPGEDGLLLDKAQPLICQPRRGLLQLVSARGVYVKLVGSHRQRVRVPGGLEPFAHIFAACRSLAYGLIRACRVQSQTTSTLWLSAIVTRFIQLDAASSES